VVPIYKEPKLKRQNKISSNIMDSKVAFIVNTSFIFAILLATCGDAQYSTLKCTTAPSPRFSLKPCADRLITVCRDEFFGYIYEHHETVRKECCIELVKMGRWCHNHLTFTAICNFMEKVPELECRGNQVCKLCDRVSGMWSLEMFHLVLSKMFYFLRKYYIFWLAARILMLLVMVKLYLLLSQFG